MVTESLSKVGPNLAFQVTALKDGRFGVVWRSKIKRCVKIASPKHWSISELRSKKEYLHTAPKHLNIYNFVHYRNGTNAPSEKCHMFIKWIFACSAEVRHFDKLENAIVRVHAVSSNLAQKVSQIWFHFNPKCSQQVVQKFFSYFTVWVKIHTI